MSRSPVRHYMQIFVSLDWANREISNIRFIYIFWLVIYTGKNNRFPFWDILEYLKNTHKKPKFGRVRQVPTRELGYANPGFHNCQEFFQPLKCLYQDMRTQEKSFLYCFYKITFPRKKAKLSCLQHWLKDKFLPVARSCTRVFSLCFAKKMPSKIRAFLA